ncbi:hypothetical protein TNCT_481 [Trichonephila clavata]|uniref:Uncharacterized protein n=1 Tax=Trichonephila clavata TaxID=2740835 RepID=A0A8X6FDA4_TRICU|nr:hypothetical protein TNCT_481 [Trichonephila clavata]
MYVLGHMTREHMQGQKVDTKDDTTCFFTTFLLFLPVVFPIQVYIKEVVPVNGRETMANHIHLSQADIAKLTEASDSKEVSEYENHTSEEIESNSSNNYFLPILSK